MTDAIPTYWWAENNFGDSLTDAIFEHYGLPAVYAPPEEAKVVGAGSILEHLKNEYSGYVLGSGFLYPTSRRLFPNATILSLRGPLTAQQIERDEPCLLGDLGLLAAHLVGDIQVYRRLGVVLHYADNEQPLRRLAAENPDVFLIDVRRSPQAVITDIASCDAIVSSSLHGLIVADALQIPSAWKYCDKVLGSGFKFRDHNAAVESPRQVHDLSAESTTLLDVLNCLSKPPPRAETLAHELHGMMSVFTTLMRYRGREPR